MKKAFLIVIIFAVVCCSCVTRENDRPQDSFFSWITGKRTLLSENLVVTTDWQEISLPDSVKSGVPIHNLVLEVEDWKQWNLTDPQIITDPQGREVKIDVRFVDKDGNFYNLTGQPNVDHLKFWLGETKENTNFTKLRIKSNISFKCSQLIWERHYN